MDIFALFHPSAHDARLEWQARQELPAPIPTPGEGPLLGLITGGRIVIEVGAER
ncbi:hypothetical protein ACTU3I_17180 [Microbacterium sp. RD1]|uniref:hypothetical protein n=1 Tax=Microbacterium sp. RD1 TaxID=3457313 RepID=UPI003FA52A5E